MTSSVRILTTYTLDSSPSILLVAPNGDKTLINCGEGCQRSFLESPGLKVRSVTRVCLTHLGHDAVGGLPGMVLTTADVSESILASVVQEDTGVADFPSVKRKDHPEQPLVGASVDDTPPDLVVVGPTGTQAFLHSLRHFMRRDKFRMTVRQGEYCQMQGENVPSVRSKSNKRSRKELSGDTSNSTSEEGFLVQTIPTKQYSGDSNHDEREILSFVFTTPRVKGKFLPDKASELGVPRGPMFAKLKSGRSVSFVDASGNEQTVHSHEVVEKAGPCVAVAVLYCPSLYVLVQLQQSSVVNSLFRYAGDSHVLDMVLHLVPEPLFRSREYGVFRERFYHGTDHVWLETYSNLTSVGSRMMSVRHEPSPFQAAVLGAQTRSMLNDDIYLSVQTRGYEPGDSDIPKVMKGRSRTEYTLIPRSKKGFTEKPPPTKSEVSSVLEQKKITDSTFIANVVSGVHCTSTCPTMQGQAIANSTLHFAGELIFTGTGSALPCKHRNVTGIYMQMSNGKSLLLDVGEGTVGQILRAKRDEVCYDQLLCRIKAVWISTLMLTTILDF